MKFFTQLFCRHDFKHVEDYCLDDKSKMPGTKVAKGYKCTKCAKRKLVLNDTRLEFRQ